MSKSKNRDKGRLPHGWTWQRVDRGYVRPVTPEGVVVPIVDHPLVGDEEQRAALRELQAWREGAE